VLATLQLGAAILSEGAMSFLGIGVPPPAPSWGGMLAGGSDYLTPRGGWPLPGDRAQPDGARFQSHGRLAAVS